MLLLLISWESDRWKLVCQIGSLSNRSLGLPLCKQQHQSIPSPILPQQFIVPTKCLSFISICLPLRLVVAHFPSSFSLLPDSVRLLAALLLTSVVLQLFESCFSSRTSNMLLWLSTNLIATPNSHVTTHGVFAVSPPHPLSGVVWRNENGWSRVGEHGLPV